jgi:predicted nucleic acid-binding Zn ribbon protein
MQVVSIDFKKRAKRPSELTYEVNELLESLRNVKKQRFAFWRNVVGDKIAEIAVPSYKKNSVLIVKVSDSVWRFELTRRKEELLQSVNAALSENKKLKDIIFK